MEIVKRSVVWGGQREERISGATGIFRAIKPFYITQ